MIDVKRAAPLRANQADVMGPPPQASYSASFSSLDSASSLSSAAAQPKRKRQRRIIACLACHRRRVKCDFGRPCSACVRHGVENTCAYQNSQSNDKSRIQQRRHNGEPHSGTIDDDENNNDGDDDDDDDDDDNDDGNNDSYGARSAPRPRGERDAGRPQSSSSAANESSSSSSARRTGTGLASISPQSYSDDTSPNSSSGGSLAALSMNPSLGMLLKPAHDEATDTSDPRHTSSLSSSPHVPPPPAGKASTDATRKDSISSNSYIYSRSDADKMRAACADWPEADRLPSLVKFFLVEVNGLLIMMEAEDVNSFIKRRIMPLLECRSDSEAFFNRLRPGDATKLAMTATMIANSAMKCSLGVLVTWFTRRMPGKRMTSFTPAMRDKLTKMLKTSVKTLLDESVHGDAPDYGQVRAIIAFIDLLKGEGTLAGPEAQTWFPRLSEAARACNLHREPPSDVDSVTRETHRRLFVSFVSTNWYGATVYGEHLRFPAEDMCTTFPQKMLNREHECLMLRFRMGRLFQPISQAARNAACEWRAIDDIEDDLTETIRQFPADLRPEQSVDERQLFYTETDSATMVLQKHLLSSFYYYLRGLTHRMRFFHHPDIPVERVRYSRQACIDSAKSILWTQQEFRAQYFSDAWLRGFHFVYFTLEPSVILALAALTTLGDAETEETTAIAGGAIAAAWEGGRLENAVAKARSYLDWSQRGADLMNTLPMDVLTNIQAAQFIERLVTKTTNLVDWYETYARSSNGPRMPIFSAASATKHVLSDSDGQPLRNALLDNSLRGMNMEKEGDLVPQLSSSNVNVNAAMAAAPIAPIVSAPFGSVSAASGQDFDVLSSTSAAAAPPALMDLGMGGFDSLSFSLPRPNYEEQENVDIVTMFDTAPPLEEQIDVWLALLQQ